MVLCSVWGWGQGNVTITRSSFPSGTGYTSSTWNATASTGETITGTSNLFLTTVAYIQIGGTQIPHPYNSTAIPGAITKIEITMPGSGSLRAWTPSVSASTEITSASEGTKLAAKTFTSNSGTLSWDLDAADNYRYFYLQAGGNTNIAEIKITYQVAAACQTSDLAFTNTTVSQDLSTGTYTQTATSLNGTTGIIYSSSDETVATVNPNTGVVNFVTAGTVTITATQAEGTHNATLYCTGTATYDLTITSSAPSLVITGAADHGDSCIGTSITETFTITNSGNSSAGGLTVVSDNSQFVVSNLSATTVPGSNGTVTFDVTFTPASSGAQNATITVQSSTSGSNVATFDITGTGNTTVDPALATSAATSISATEATLNGEITSLGTCLSNPLTEKGFVYGTSVNPEFSGGTFLTDGTAATGVFDATVTTLSPATTYYYKAYVMDGTGQYYFSNELSFTTTLDAPVATAATNITPAGFTANWNAVTGADSYVLEVYEETGAPMTDLIISEYVEGSSNNKYLEIYNGTGVDVDLSTYSVTLHANGTSGITNTQNLSDLQPILLNGATIVLRNSGANLTTPIGVATYISSVCNFNGDDAVVLRKNGFEIDIFGVIGDDPGTAWTGAGGYSTLDKTLRRKSNVTGGVTVNPTGTGETAFTTLTTEWDLFDINTVSDLGSHTANTVTQTLLSTQNVGNVLTFDVTGLNPDSNYTYSVIAVKGTVESAVSNTISVTTLPIITWDGSAWSNGTGPDASMPAVIDNDYDGSSFEAASLTVNSGATLTVNSFVRTGDVVNNGTITVANNANFIQTGTFTAGAGSAFNVRRVTKPVLRLGYISWSSPMASSTQTLKEFSYGKLNDGSNQSATGTLDNRFYTYSGASYVTIPSGNTFVPGQGYQIRTPNDFTTTAQNFQGWFTGSVPNSGNITYDATAITGDYVFLGNPYPGSISALAFLQENTGVASQTLYVWDSASAMDAGNQYTGNTYWALNPTGTVPFGTDDELIATGQGFFVERGASQNSFNFTNAMRVTDATSGVFQKAGNGVNDKFWLQMESASGAKSQVLMAFAGAATAGFDSTYDGKLLGEGTDVMYTKAGGHKLVIDAHATFQNNDQFNVFINTSHIQNYTISVVHRLGALAAAGQSVYIKDKATGVITDLTSGNYSFTSAGIGEEDRFEVFFSSMALGTSETVKHDIQVYGNEGMVTVLARKDITKVSVYDMSGRLLSQKTEKARTVSIPAKGAVYVMVVVELADGSKVSKKVKI